MKKKIISVIMVIMLTVGTCNVAAAAENGLRGSATRDSLKSYGSIEYHKGDDSVVINSDDLYELADQIDQVKLDVNDQLAALNTYFTAGEGMSLNTTDDINVVHAEPVKEDYVDPLTVNFDTLLEGIAVSQSVPQDVTAYGFAAGTELYKNTNGALTTDGSEEGAEKISVTAATADNLSAGKAAWVDGNLILGTGEDNKSYSESFNNEIVSCGIIGSASYSGYSIKFSLPPEAAICIIKADHNSTTVYDGLFVYHIQSGSLISYVPYPDAISLSISQLTDTDFAISGNVGHTVTFYLWYIY